MAEKNRKGKKLKISRYPAHATHSSITSLEVAMRRMGRVQNSIRFLK
jgi:hypothetical protein